MHVSPDAAAVIARLRALARRAALQTVLRGAAAGLVAAALLIAVDWQLGTRWPRAALAGIPVVIAVSIALMRARRRDRQIARDVEARVPSCQNVVITSAEIARGPRAVRDDVSARIHADAVKALAPLRSSALFPIGREIAALSVGAALVAGASLLVARANAPGLAAVDPEAAELHRVTVTITPPSYTGMAAETLHDPERVSAMAGSRIALRITANATRLAVATLAGSVNVQPHATGDFAAELEATANGFIAIEPHAADGRAGERRLLPLSVTDDRAPAVRITAPAKDLFLTQPQAELEVVVAADDDLALASLTLKYTRVTGSGENFTFTSGDVPLALTRTSARAWTGRARWRIDALVRERGDVIVYRAVATDQRPGRAPVESDAFMVELLSPNEEAAEGFAVDDQREKYALSQQMIIVKTERLLAAKPKMSAEAFTEGSLTIAAEQRTVRAEFVFMMGGEIEDEEEEAEHSHEIAEGRLGTGGRADIIRAIKLMSQAATLLNDIKAAEALPIEKQALAALQRAFSRNRLILRALTRREQLDMTRRLSGTFTDLSRDPRAVPAVAADPARAAARQVLADTLEVARLPSWSRAHAAEMTIAAQELFRLAAGHEAYRAVATELSAAAAAMSAGHRDDARGRLDRAATALAAIMRAGLPQAPGSPADLSGAALRGALDDARRKGGE